MNYSFASDLTTEICFGLNIAGTNSRPQSVTVVLERDGTAASWTAEESADQWLARVHSPGSMFTPGPVKMSVKIVLNGKLFVPFSVQAQVLPSEVLASKHQSPAVECAQQLPLGAQEHTDLAADQQQPDPTAESGPQADTAVSSTNSAQAASLTRNLENVITELVQTATKKLSTGVKEFKPQPIPTHEPVPQPEVADIIAAINSDQDEEQAVNRKISLLKSMEPPSIKKITAGAHHEQAAPVKESRVFSIKKKGTTWR